MISLNYFEEKITYWEKLKKILLYVVYENIKKAWAIQNNNFNEVEIDRDVYEKLDWNKILENQNKVSGDHVSGIIWVLCTCIIFLGEYKFFWEAM